MLLRQVELAADEAAYIDSCVIDTGLAGDVHDGALVPEKRSSKAVSFEESVDNVLVEEFKELSVSSDPRGYEEVLATGLDPIGLVLARISAQNLTALPQASELSDIKSVSSHGSTSSVATIDLGEDLGFALFKLVKDFVSNRDIDVGLFDHDWPD